MTPIFFPKQTKSRQLLLRKVMIYVGQRKYLEHVLAGLPIGRQRAGFIIVFQRRVIARPLSFHVGNEFAVPGADTIAAFAPIKDKLRDCVLNEVGADIDALQNFQRIFAGRPLAAHRRTAVDPGLMASPGLHHMLEKFITPGITGVAAFAPVMNKLGQLAGDKSVFDTMLL